MKLVVIFAMIIAGIIFFMGFNDHPEVTVYTIESNKVKDTVRICLLSDLHSSNYGNQLVELVDQYDPDVIVMAGDIFEARYGFKHADEMVDSISKYPFYYVTGNHECRCKVEEKAKEHIVDRGGHVLSGKSVIFEAKGEKIQLLGIDDLNARKYDFTDQVIHAKSFVDERYFSVLVSHEPQMIDLYESCDWDMVVCGHAHGGQWIYKERGLFAPQQGLFPKYTQGVHVLKNDTKLVISRGLCKSYPWAPRLFNRPEIVMIDIKGVKE
ncbi:MAG: metallophosphoesterase family protein [Erysipelotrichaceae bacterium]|nr:metallophosphoesterase family protein [Erysipelotrichaceae bacterium]